MYCSKKLNIIIQGYWLVMLVWVLIMTFQSCRIDDYYDGTDVDVTFSEDTLRFDTVFTTVGSATRFIKIFNPKPQSILVDVELLSAPNAKFRINVDGVAGPMVKGVSISPLDSIYVFVDVKIDPDEPLSISPFVIEQQLKVTVNGKEKLVQLEAFGQNANYIPSNRGARGAALLSCNLGQVTWNDPKPYVIYGLLYIDSCTLVLPAGTTVYVHGGIVREGELVYRDGLLVFLENGKLITQGTVDEPVIFQGDRLESSFQDVVGQWSGIYFFQNSTGNILAHTKIKNSSFGVRLDSLSEASLKNTTIYNTAGPAILSRHGSVKATNCLFFNNNSNALQLIYGGNHEFTYCTVASYGNRNAGLFMTNWYREDIFTIPRINGLKARFTNCVIAGNESDEISLSQIGTDQALFDYRFDHCAFRVDTLLLPDNFPEFLDYCDEPLRLKFSDRLFLDRNEDDFRLDTMSVLIGKGVHLPQETQDIIGVSRKDIPDIGCYELRL